MPITEKDLDRYYAAKLMKSFRNVFGFKDEKFETHSEDIEKENLKQGYDKTPKRPIDVCDRCHEVVHAIVPWRVNRSGYLQWVCLRCDRELREGKR